MKMTEIDKIKTIDFLCWNSVTKENKWCSITIQFESEEDFEDAVERQFEEDRERLQNVIDSKYQNFILDRDEDNNQLIFNVLPVSSPILDLIYEE